MVISIGAMMTAFGRKIVANRELHEAREELARLAVSEERLRIARDLHDLLGHSLSVIALKSDIQTVTRQAVAEVREAVQGYRRQGLADELDHARTALRAADIERELDAPPDELPADVEAVLAWAVRGRDQRGAPLRGAALLDQGSHRGRAAVEVVDNGRFEDSRGGGGNGLTGLAERAEGVHGTFEAGARPEGGFRLRLTVPLADS